MVIATGFIFIRSVYRVAELEGGFDGKIAKDEPAFMIFEGPMLCRVMDVWCVVSAQELVGCDAFGGAELVKLCTYT